MKNAFLSAACMLILAGCAGSSFHIPLSSEDPPPAHAAVDEHCMQDCLGDNSDPDLCRSRCAK